MGAIPQKVLHWMYNVLKGEYQNPDRTYSDVAQTLDRNPSFSLRTSVYTYENGYSALLLNAAGTLAVKFRGTTYMFPISIWMPQEYPRGAPMGFVTPTKNMAIRPGQHVSGEGRVYHPYLAGWREDSSNLPEFISVLQDVFAREPPLIAKQEQPSPQSPQSLPNGGPPPVPPLPPELNRPDSRSTSSPKPPPPPPKPYDTRSQPQSQQLNGPPPLPPHPPKLDDRYSVEPERRINAQRGSAQAFPPNPPQRPSSLRQQNEHELPEYRGRPAPDDRRPPEPQGQQMDHRSQQSLPTPMQAGPSQRPIGHQGLGLQPLPNDHPGNQGYWNDQHLHYLPHQQLAPNQSKPRPQERPASQHYPQQQHAPQPTPTQPPQPAPLPQPKAPQVDLLTSPFDTPLPTAVPASNVPPPPIPPNPQKDALLSTLSATLTDRIHSAHAANQSALPALNTQHTALTTTLQNLNHEISQLESLERLLASNEAILHRAMRDADKVLADAQSKPIPDIDKILIAGTVVESQLYNVVVEERAIVETRAFLGRCLDRGRIGGEAWARATRGLAREEFAKRALGRKIARGMGLRGVEGRD